MCKEHPGPRCSNHVKKQRSRLKQQLHEAVLKHDKNSLAVKQASRSYHEIEETYKTTPDGLKDVAKNEPKTLPYYQKTRDFQSEAYKEEHNGRVEQLTKFIASTQEFYDNDEIHSIIQNTRKAEEQRTLESIRSGAVTPMSKQDTTAEYNELMSRYADYAQRVEADTDSLKALQEMPPPSEAVTVRSYAQALKNLEGSQIQLRRELSRVATMQDTSPQITAAYYDAYREQYKTEFAHLDKKEQPNPPKEWVEGVYSNTGFRNTANTSLIPNDPASMYACYRLRSDSQAIPDYLKQARSVSSFQVNQEAGTINIVSANSKGKTLTNVTLPYSEKLTPQIGDALEGKILLVDNNRTNMAWAAQLRKQGLENGIITSTDLMGKHLNSPDYDAQTFCQTANVDYAPNDRAGSLLQSYFKNKQQIARQWQAKPARKFASTIPNLPLNSRFIGKSR